MSLIPIPPFLPPSPPDAVCTVDGLTLSKDAVAQRIKSKAENSHLEF